jgi:hypothetical protein
VEERLTWGIELLFLYAGFVAFFYFVGGLVYGIVGIVLFSPLAAIAAGFLQAWKERRR